MAGATYDIVVLSSSPPDSHDAAPPAPASPAERRVATPPSPLLSSSPLLSPRGATSGALRSGSRAAPVPTGTERGFATARSLLADININDRGLSAIEEALEHARAPTGPANTIKASNPPRKRAPKVRNASGLADKPKATAKPRGRKAKATSAEQVTGRVSNLEATDATTSSHFATVPAADATAPTRETAKSPSELQPAKAPRKPRAKKAATGDCGAQTTIKRTRITKPRASTKTAKKAQEAAAEVLSAHFRARGTGDDAVDSRQTHVANSGFQNPQTSDASLWDVPLSPSTRSNGSPKQRPPDADLSLDLDAAVSRRRDWTPPPESVHQEILSGSVGKENRPDAIGLGKEGFTSMLSGYSYAHSAVQSEQLVSNSVSSEAPAAMKRRRVELIDLPGNQIASRQASPEKGKAPKKKARTITDLVTGQYAAPQQPPESPDVTSDFFARRTATVAKTTKVPLNDVADADSTKASKKPVRKRSTSKSASEKGETKARSKKASAKAVAKPKLAAEKLLSPMSALSRMDRQDVLFGTSSQLARDDSPTMVREIQRAILESEQDADAHQSLASDKVPDIAPWPRLQRIEGRRALWRASSRDDDGQMLERQSVYLPEPDRTQDFLFLPTAPHEQPDDSFLSISDFAPPPKASIAISSDLPTPPPTIAEDCTQREVVRSSPFLDIDNLLPDAPPIAVDSKDVSTAGHAATSSPFQDIDDFPQDAPPSNQTADSSFLDIDAFAPSAQASTSDFLSRVASMGSPKRRRGRPSKSPSAIPRRVPASPSAPARQQPPTSSKPLAATSPSTPRKSKARFHGIEAILDSEDDEALSPTPPRTRRLEDSPSLPLVSQSGATPAKASPEVLVPIYAIAETSLTFEGIRPALFPRITSLIRSLPPTTDITKPSWHEKILMYDAIVAEDFTAFLNTHDQMRTYKRATQKQVKAWNKELKRKGEQEMKTADGDGMVLAVEKEVEAWMVQKWCEEMSVCCVVKDKKNGGARKGLY